MQLNRSFVSLIFAASLSACGGGSEEETDAKNIQYYLFATDHEANLNIFADYGGDDVEQIVSKKPINADGTEVTELGEIHFNKGKAFVIVRNGVTVDNENVGSGVAVVDIESQEIEHLFPLKSDITGRLSRAVHTYVDKDRKYLWMNNDGTGANDEEVAKDDSVFRINIDPDDNMDMDGDSLVDDKFGDVVEIPAGNGHKKSAFVEPSDSVNAPKLFVTHDLSAQTVTIIDNDPASDTFLQRIQTIDINDGRSDGSVNLPHGMGYSKASGHVYTGIIVNGQDLAMHIIDTTSDGFDVSVIEAGDADGEIPQGGYIKASHDGKHMYMAGYVSGSDGNAGSGYLSIVDAENNNNVAAVIPIGDAHSSSVNVAAYMMDMGEMQHHMTKLIVPSTNRGGEKDVIKIVNADDIDLSTGTLKDGKSVTTLTIGPGGRHRNGKVSSDGLRAYYPNGGDCGDENTPAGPDCNTIAIVDIMTNTVATKVQTQGHEPGNVGVISADELAGNDEIDHTHH